MSDDYEVINGEEDDTPEEGDEEEDFEKQSEKWSEIPLSAPLTKSNSSTSSSYSEQAVAPSNDNEKEIGDEEKKQSGSFSSWISKNSFRRSSLEDVFAQSFGKFGRSMERRNSESEVEVTTTKSKDFFLFNKQELTDSQISLIFHTE